MVKAVVMAKRETFNGTPVEFWTDGAITIGHPMYNRLVARDVSRKILMLIAEDVSLYSDDEVKGLVKAARRALDAHERAPHRTPESDLRRLMRAYAA